MGSLIFIVSIIILQTINPEVAVENIANASLIGSFFIIFIVLVITVGIVVKKAVFKFIDRLNTERLENNKEAEANRKAMLDYVMQKNDIFVEVIKNYSDSNDSLKTVLEKIIMKL
ncbi:MAG: hypothetical protein L3J56_04240 [Bacteroidales bacterium]|nr:hypothetical protein [Bacteroidales bacterium]